MYSDNGINSVDSSNDLRSLAKSVKSNEQDIINTSNNHKVFSTVWWKLGGRCKHNEGSLDKFTFIFQKFQSILIQIEGILNSLSLSLLSNDPTDFYPLSLSHFFLSRLL